MSEEVPASLFERVVPLVDGPNIVAIVLLGSLARGEETPWSDLDVERWFTTATEMKEGWPRFIDGRLLMVSSRTVDDVWKELRSAERAIWAVPAYRTMRVLVDRRGDAAAIHAAAVAFDWEQLREDAAHSARLIVAKSAEYVFKIRAAVERQDESAALHAEGSLIGRCARAVAIGRGVLVRSENEYYRRVCETAGDAWTRAFRSSFGLEDGDAFSQARAACRLYTETVLALEDLLDADTRVITARALAIAPR